jgi:hypothetical protein
LAAPDRQHVDVPQGGVGGPGAAECAPDGGKAFGDGAAEDPGPPLVTGYQASTLVGPFPRYESVRLSRIGDRSSIVDDDMVSLANA